MGPVRTEIPIEYRQTGWGKVLNLALAGLLLAVGAVAAVLSVTRFASIQGKVMSTLIIGGALYWFWAALCARVLIEENRISVRTPFGERIAGIGEISAYRSVHGRGGGYTLLYLRDGSGAIRVSWQMFDLDDRFRAWLQQFPVAASTKP